MPLVRQERGNLGVAEEPLLATAGVLLDVAAELLAAALLAADAVRLDAAAVLLVAAPGLLDVAA